MCENVYDMIIVGSGPAGLTAGIYGKRAGLKVVILESGFIQGGQIVNTYEVDNWQGGESLTVQPVTGRSLKIRQWLLSAAGMWLWKMQFSWRETVNRCI